MSFSDGGFSCFDTSLQVGLLIIRPPPSFILLAIACLAIDLEDNVNSLVQVPQLTVSDMLFVPLEILVSLRNVPDFVARVTLAYDPLGRWVISSIFSLFLRCLFFSLFPQPTRALVTLFFSPFRGPFLFFRIIPSCPLLLFLSQGLASLNSASCHNKRLLLATHLRSLEAHYLVPR